MMKRNENGKHASGVLPSKRLGVLGVAGAVAVALTLVAGGASAQTKEITESKTDDGYGYSFDDDPLNAGGFGPNDATIRVRARAARTTLIRPRTSFVPEMLKSVENL
jgi:hypothetical protein